jgi:DNA-binding PadR family transcriptional regulator
MKQRRLKRIKPKTNRRKKVKEIDPKHLQEIASLLYTEFRRKRRKETYAQVKEILSLLAKGGYLLSCFLAPGLTRIAPDILGSQPEWEEWKRFNKTYLRRSLKRLEKQGLVAFREDEDKAIIRITKFGEQYVLKYALDNLQIKKPKIWDGKWRLIIYDVSIKKEYFQRLFRETIKKLGLYQLQKSVYLTPFDCKKEIDFLREYFGVKIEVLYFTTDRFEKDEKYRKYFKI